MEEIQMKRFTETDKWKDTWFRKLQPAEKLLWIYILDNCDNAGFFELDVEMCCFLTGMEENRVLGAIKGLNRGLIGAKSDGLFYVKNFLKHQKNFPLNPDNNAHKQILTIIDDRLPSFKSGAIQGLVSPIGKGRGKGKSTGKKETGGYSDEFEQFWKAYPKKTGKGGAWSSWKSHNPPIDKCLYVVESQKKSVDWTKEGGKYIPNPQTWINQSRWEDEGVSGSTKWIGTGKNMLNEQISAEGLTIAQHKKKYGTLV